METDSTNYTLYCLTEGGVRVRYFGITKELGSHRFQEHINESRNGDRKLKSVWIRECAKNGIETRCHTIRENLTKRRALHLESMLIRLFQTAFGLVNSQKHSMKRKNIENIKRSPKRNGALVAAKARLRMQLVDQAPSLDRPGKVFKPRMPKPKFTIVIRDHEHGIDCNYRSIGLMGNCSIVTSVLPAQRVLRRKFECYSLMRLNLCDQSTDVTYPSFLKQTKWESGIYGFPVDPDRPDIVRFNCSFANAFGKDYLVTRNTDRPLSKNRRNTISFWELRDNKPVFERIVRINDKHPDENHEDPRVLSSGGIVLLSWTSIRPRSYAHQNLGVVEEVGDYLSVNHRFTFGTVRTGITLCGIVGMRRTGIGSGQRIFSISFIPRHRT